MAVLRYRSVAVEVDDDGFLRRPELWDDEVALALASTEGLGGLEPDHWRVVSCIRDHYAEAGEAPLIRELCERTDLSLGQIYDLFPSGPALGACKVAGLPRPDGCV